jgi:ABC-type sulfate/molybdate transport systems ATPase subunit
LDEPFSSLDIAIKAHLFTEIRHLCEEFGVTVVLVSHDPLEAAALCSFGAVMEDGRVIESGMFRELLQTPQSATLRAFVGQLPQSLTPERGGNVG